MFEIVVFDDDEDFDEVPTTLLPLATWLDEKPYERSIVDPVGIRVSDGGTDWLAEAFAHPQALAQGCDEAADRLAAGRAALLRADADVSGVYLFFGTGHPAPFAMIQRADDDAHPWPYLSSNSSDVERTQVADLLAWADKQGPALATPTGRGDANYGRGLALPRASLIEDLRRAAEELRAYEQAL
jgi:hypothetical protein